MDLSEHPFFEPVADPVSGVVTWVLTRRVATTQQSFYFTNAAISADEKWLWFHTGFPPNPQRALGVVSLDPSNPAIHHFPRAGFSSESPMVAESGDAVYFCCGPSVVRLELDGSTHTVFRLPEDYIAGRRLHRLATHLSSTADGRFFLIDGEVGNHWFVATADRETGEFQLIKEFAHCHNHAQCSPVDPKRFVISMDHFRDAVSGRHFHYDHRAWLMDLDDEQFVSLTPHVYAKPMTGICHEWWSRDGRLCYVDYSNGVWELDLEANEHTHVWREPLCHAHCDGTRQYWCADQSPYTWQTSGCVVKFYDRQRDRVTLIRSSLPLPPVDRSLYHIDPHPQFSPRGTWINYTTTARGRVDVGLVRVADLLNAAS